MIAACEHFRNFQPAKLRRARVVRIVEQAARTMCRTWRSLRVADEMLVAMTKALKGARVLVAQYSWQQPHRGVDDHSSAKLAARKNIVADGKLAVADEFVNPLIHTLIAPADQDEMIQRRQRASRRLRELGALRRKQHHR